MKNVLLKLSSLCFIAIFFLFSNSIYAQDPATETLSKDELKLLKLEEKVQRAKDRIKKTEDKLAYADSLMQAGLEMTDEANTELDIIQSEEKAYVKAESIKYKNLKKTLKKADDDDVKSIESELKAMNSAYTKGLKKFENRAKIEIKKLTKGDSNISKAKDKDKQYSPVLKDNHKALELAEEQLANFKAEKEL